MIKLNNIEFNEEELNLLLAAFIESEPLQLIYQAMGVAARDSACKLKKSEIKNNIIASKLEESAKYKLFWKLADAKLIKPAMSKDEFISAVCQNMRRSV